MDLLTIEVVVLVISATLRKYCGNICGSSVCMHAYGRACVCRRHLITLHKETNYDSNDDELVIMIIIITCTENVYIWHVIMPRQRK